VTAAVLLAIALVTAACGADPLAGFSPASPEDRGVLVTVLREYYDLLGRAQVTGDVGPLFARHPDLARGEDRREGVNTEASLVQHTRALGLREVSVDLESYEPVKAFVRSDLAVAYVHGLFTWAYQNGSITKGELSVRFDLARRGGIWTIVRTDERVLGETPAPTPR